MVVLSEIRNFCIIAHIDHGKSTLADRMLQITHSIDERVFRDQVLDDMDLERERGITIKSHPVSMRYDSKDGSSYLFNLIDTPGHVDFTYEVSRSMAACEGALLIVDATQGVEAQTVANTYMAIDRGLEILPVINKIDLPNADVPEVQSQIRDLLGIEPEAHLLVSAKTGKGVPEVMEAVVRKIPPPKISEKGDAVLRALVFDSVYDKFRGAVAHLRVFDGGIKRGDRVLFMAAGVETEVKEVGMFHPKPAPCERLGEGCVGYVIGTVKDPADIQVGDTITGAKAPAPEPLSGFKRIHPMVFAGLYPIDAGEYEKFRTSLQKLSLNDSSLSFHPENSVALGFGFRCGFLGLLHMEIIQERLLREYELNLISTYPAVIYRVTLSNGSIIEVDNPVELPDSTRIDTIEEPVINAFIICRNGDIGDILKLVRDRRGSVDRTESADSKRVMLTCSLPLNEILTDFHDTLKSISQGYASMDYEHAGYQASDIVRLDVLVNSEPIDAFSSLVHRSKAEYRGRQICKVLKDAIPPHQFTIPVQAAIGRNIIARETIRAFRKDVTAKLYGGDVTRKMKLLEKQKAGKRKMKQFGQVNVPQKAFVSVLRSA